MIEFTENIFLSFPTYPSYFNIMTQKPKYRKNSQERFSDKIINYL